jgi:hypothetical protein
MKGSSPSRLQERAASILLAPKPSSQEETPIWSPSAVYSSRIPICPSALSWAFSSTPAIGRLSLNGLCHLQRKTILRPRSGS